MLFGVLTLAALASAAAGATIPFAWTPGQIEVAVLVDGTPATFLLDTGSEYSVVSTRLARQLGLATSPGGSREFADGVTLKVGSLVLERQRVMVMPFETFYARGRQIDGLVGYDFFAAYTVAIDFGRRQLTAWRPSSFVAPAAAVAVPITFAGRLPVVAASLRPTGRPPIEARLLVDTGASQSIMLRNPFSRAHGLLDRPGPESSAPSLASGRQRVADVDVDTLAIGALTFDRPRAQAFVEATGAAGSTETDGLIGNALLSRYRIYVDYRNRLLLFAPAQKE